MAKSTLTQSDAADKWNYSEAKQSFSDRVMISHNKNGLFVFDFACGYPVTGVKVYSRICMTKADAKKFLTAFKNNMKQAERK